MPEYIDWFVDRDKQYQGFQKMLARQTPKSVMLVEAPADMGKSWLVQRMRHHSQENNTPVLHVDFRDRRPHDYLSLVRLARDQMGPAYFNHLTNTINNFTGVNITLTNASTTTGASGGNSTSGGVNVSEVAGDVSVAGDVAGRDIIKDNQFYIQADSAMARRAAEIQISDAFFACLNPLIAEKKAAVFIYDSYEDVTTEADAWLKDYLLARIGDGQLKNALVIIAGRKVPELSANLKEHIAKTGLDLFTEEHVKDYVGRRKLTGLDLATIVKTSGGNPGLLAKMADVATVDTKSDEEWL